MLCKNFRPHFFSFPSALGLGLRSGRESARSPLWGSWGGGQLPPRPIVPCESAACFSPDVGQDPDEPAGYLRVVEDGLRADHGWMDVGCFRAGLVLSLLLVTSLPAADGGPPPLVTTSPHGAGGAGVPCGMVRVRVRAPPSGMATSSVMPEYLSQRASMGPAVYLDGGKEGPCLFFFRVPELSHRCNVRLIV